MSTSARPFGRKQTPEPVPDAKSSYQLLLKRELANRLTLIFTMLLTLIFLMLFIPTFNFHQGPPLGTFGHLMAVMIMAFSTFVIGALPMLVLRGRAVSAKEIPPPTRAGTLVALATSSWTWRTLVYYTASGFGLTFLHVALISLTEWGDSCLTVFSPTRRNALRLNERFFYLAFLNASLGLIFALRDVLRHRWIPKWPHVNDDPDAVIFTAPSSSILEALLAMLNCRALLSTTLITTFHVFAFPLAYHVTCIFAVPILRSLPAAYWLTRPLLHGFRRTWTVDVAWSRMFALCFKTSITWELVEASFDYWSVKPIVISSKAQDPNRALIAGLLAQDLYSKHHAYLELSALAASPSAASAARRIALFADTRTTPSLWSALLRELLVSLGRDYQALLRRGRPVPPTPTPKFPPASSVLKTPKTPSTPLLRQPILRPSPRGLLDRLIQDDATTQNPTPAPRNPDHASIPSVFLPDTPPTASMAKKAVTYPVKPETGLMSYIVQGLRSWRHSAVMVVSRWVERKLPPEWRVREWWTDVNLENVAKACLAEADLDVAGIHGLSHLIAASLTEDALGVVQRDIARVLEALLSFLGEAESYKAELEAKLPPTKNSNQGDVGYLMTLEASKKVARAVGVVQPVIVALRTGIGLIAKTFGDRLSVYKFPPPTAKRLQEFLDYL